MADTDKVVEQATDTALGVHATEWWVTPWSIADSGHDWKQQPIILVVGEPPFFASHPAPYIAKLEEMRADQRLMRGPFNQLVGQLKDALDASDWGPSP